METVSIIRPPRTLLEMFKQLPEGTRVQLIENNLIMSPAPLFVHQEVLMEIIFHLQSFIRQNELGKIVVAPIDVYLDKKDAFQPDIIFISKERLNIIRKNGIYGAPDMIIEILSPSTAKYDLKEKKDVYERYGVKEYWTVEPESKQTEGYFLNNNTFESLGKNNGIIDCRILKTTFKF